MAFLAMAHWQTGDRARARDLLRSADIGLAGYEKRWKRHHVYPEPAMLRRVLAEAAALLGVNRPRRGGVEARPRIERPGRVSRSE